MTISAAMSTRLILQGEVGIWGGTTGLKLHTSTPTSCTVLTLYSAADKIGAMAHIDDYTSVEHVFYTLNEKAQNKFGQPLNALNFKAKVIGGTSCKFSLIQRQKVVDALTKNSIPFEKIPHESESKEKRPQVVLNTSDGTVELLLGNKKNHRLEYLQMREYSFFNRFQLDLEYASVKGDQIPFFESIFSTRKESDIPEFPLKDLSAKSVDATLALEDSGQLQLPITSWKRTAIIANNVALATLKDLIEKLQSPVLTKALEERNFNLLLRQSCANKALTELTKYLLGVRFVLEIDLNSKGKTSGTALEVATKESNEKAVQLLKEELR